MTRTALLASLLLAACTTPRTQIMVATDTDLSIPTEIDSIVIEVIGPDGTTQLANADVATLPAYLGVYHETGALGPVLVRAVGRRAGGDVVERRAQLDFQPERTVLLRMNLLASCVGVSCGAGETCTESGCASSLVDGTGLPDWAGMVPPLDGGGMDSSGDTSMDTSPPSDTSMDTSPPSDTSPDTPGDSSPPDSSADTSVDSALPDTGTCPGDSLPGGGCTDFARDPLNCGGAGAACTSTQVCSAGSCACRPGLTDDGAGGCVDLQSDPANCGAVGRVCANQCWDAFCLMNCGPNTSCLRACVDTESHTLNCGGCGIVCTASQVCADSACRDYTVGVGCTACPCATCPAGNNCCGYPGTSVVCVDGPCP
ncbi:MAG: hypothetical protein DRJ42_20420 [Deltaproteobacteria bacterium]|nr:MAG: hypothetical protein DRJ42_20420 [Deltaproteobacteria bacterium]